MEQSQIASSTAACLDDGYAQFEKLLASRVEAAHDEPLFTTSVDPQALWGHFLTPIEESRRQAYNCHACRRFVESYGGLVRIKEDGTPEPLLWDLDGVPEFFVPSVKALRDLIGHSKVTGVFYSSGVWGTRWTGYAETDGKNRRRVQQETGAATLEWTHLSGVPRKSWNSPVKTTSAAMAEKTEDYAMIRRALADYKPSVVAEALRVLRADALTRPEKALAIAEWFSTLHEKNANQLWLAIATAPPGFAHVRSTVISTLLDDVLSGLGFDEISRRWSEKMHPLQYQRPQAPPKEGAIEQAEKTVEKLGIRKSFERRYAKLEDVLSFLWRPKAVEEKAKKEGGFFDHLRQKVEDVAKVSLPPKKITWEKFSKTVLANAKSIEVRTPHRGNYYGLVTAADPTAPPIIQWDSLENRNPVSSYVYCGFAGTGSSAETWRLPADAWVKTTAIFAAPHQWLHPDRYKNHSRQVMFALEGARDVHEGRSGLALFPEILKNELHGVRSVIEAHSKKGVIQGSEEATANGLAFGDGNEVTVRIDCSDVYTIDRWD